MISLARRVLNTARACMPLGIPWVAAAFVAFATDVYLVAMLHACDLARISTAA